MYKRFILWVKNNELIAIFLLSFLLSFLIFGNGIAGDFVFDDATIVQNRGDLKNSGDFFNLFISPYHQNMPKTGLYRPLTMASYFLNHLIFGSSPASFHIFNIVIHALNSFLVFWLVSLLFRRRSLAYISYLLFLFHPIHTEAVTSIVGRAELLAFFWSLITFYLFLKNRKILAGAAFLFALMSKESALALVPMVFFIEWSVFGKRFFAVFKNLLFFIIPLAIYSLLRYLALGWYFAGGITTSIVENPLKFVDWHERIFTALKVLSMYWEKLIWPIRLSADYSYNAIPVVKNIFSSLPSFLGLLVLTILVASFILPKIHKTSFGFGAAVFFFPYLIVSNLLFPVGTIMGERLMYFSSLGFAIMAAFILTKIFDYKKWSAKMVYGLLTAILIFYGGRAVIRNKDWHDNQALFYATVKESPNSLITRTALAGVHIRADEWDLAKEQLKIAGSIYEDNSHLQNLLGVIADHEGNYVLAEEKYRKSLELNPDAINSYINLAELYLKQGRFEKAGENFLAVINFYPTAEYVVRYSYIQIALNKPDKALGMINKHFGSDLNHPDLSAVAGTAYFVKKDYAQALVFLKKAQELGNKAPEIIEMIKIAEGNLKRR